MRERTYKTGGLISEESLLERGLIREDCYREGSY